MIVEESDKNASACASVHYWCRNPDYALQDGREYPVAKLGAHAAAGDKIPMDAGPSPRTADDGGLAAGDVIHIKPATRNRESIARQNPRGIDGILGVHDQDIPWIQITAAHALRVGGTPHEGTQFMR